MTTAQSMNIIHQYPMRAFIIRISDQIPIIMISSNVGPSITRDYKIDPGMSLKQVEDIIQYFPHLAHCFTTRKTIEDVEGKEPVELRATYNGENYLVRFNAQGNITSISKTKIDITNV